MPAASLGRPSWYNALDAGRLWPWYGALRGVRRPREVKVQAIIPPEAQTPSLSERIERHGLSWILLVAATAMGGSLFFSEIMGLTPCRLCWFQRILMYPIVVIAAVALLRDDRRASLYVLPLSVTGIFVSAYHYLLQQGVFSESIGCAKSGPPCSAIDWIAYNFITIPLLALTAFMLISLGASAALRQDLDDHRPSALRRVLLILAAVAVFYGLLAVLVPSATTAIPTGA